jgi:hypothetical protein
VYARGRADPLPALFGDEECVEELLAVAIQYPVVVGFVLPV